MTADGRAIGDGTMPESSDCWNKALDLLARRPHFRRQLEQKLRQRHFPDEIVCEVCDRLEARRFLDDLECARSMVFGGLRRKSFGPRRVRAELARRGASEAVVDEVVSEAFAQGEEAMLREAAASWVRRKRWSRDGLARHLERKGFSAGAIVRVIDDFAPSGGE